MTTNPTSDQFPGEGLPQWVISDQSGEPLEPTRLMKTLMRVASDGEVGGICLLVPVSDGVEQLAAITSAIAHMRADGETMARSHEERTFVAGQRVRTIPDGFVYEVTGKASEELGGYKIEGYWLQRLDRRKGQEGGRFLIKKADLQRLEATNSKRPIGRDRKTWAAPTLTPIDRLAGTQTFGNLSLQRNRVIVLGAKSELETGLRLLKLWLPDLITDQVWPKLSEWVAWGGLDEDGRPYIESIGNAVGEPLVAATRDFQSARKASDQAEIGQLLFVTRLIDQCLRNLETVSRLAERHRFVLVATGRDREKVAPFQKEGWLVWELSPAELLEAKPGRRPELQALRINIDAAEAEKGLSTNLYPTIDANLGECKAALATLGTCIANAEDTGHGTDDRVDDLLAELWETFLLFCSWLKFPCEAEVAQHSDNLAQLKLSNAMLKPVMPIEAWEAARLVIQSLRAFLENGKQGADTAKGLTLFDVVASVKPDLLIFTQN